MQAQGLRRLEPSQAHGCAARSWGYPHGKILPAKLDTENAEGTVSESKGKGFLASLHSTFLLGCPNPDLKEVATRRVQICEGG